MANVYDKIKERGITLPTSPPKGGVYTPIRKFRTNLSYYSSYGPNLGGSIVIGKLGKDLTAEEGQKAAYNCAPSLLANIEAKIGDLSKTKRFIKILAFVNSADDFVQRPQVVNGASSLLVELFSGEIGCPAHSAIEINALPGSATCEIEVLLEVEA